ncbi:MAG: aldehyde dehydrogenase family protein, partial [Candidatus Thermoplasmatota archaeon]|nr:aldehyde dehydrogenase family protein [Candidatus Thermoplasmatota archaeon]
GAFEYQGQKCSAASRAYIPESIWPKVKKIIQEEQPKIKCGPVDDLDNYVGAIIDEKAHKNIVGYIDHAKEHKDKYEFICGGKYDSSKGWFVEPAVIKTSDPKDKLISEEIFGPVMTVCTYPDEKFEETLKLCDNTSPFALTGSIFAQDRYAVEQAEKVLRYSAGNFYINDKPTGAVVGRQPFGGARASGTNDKAGSMLNLLRWLSPRTIKENFTLPQDWRRAFLK